MEGDSKELEAECAWEHGPGVGQGGSNPAAACCGCEPKMDGSNIMCLFYAFNKVVRTNRNDHRFQMSSFAADFFFFSFKCIILGASTDLVHPLALVASAMLSSGLGWGSLWR